MYKHGFSRRSGFHKFYLVWNSMIQRCHNPNVESYSRYGGRKENPVKVCNRWRESFENFRDDLFDQWEDGLQLDRIEGSKGYEPGNVRFVNKYIQMRNRKGVISIDVVKQIKEKLKNQRQCDIAKELKIPLYTINRIATGKSFKEI